MHPQIETNLLDIAAKKTKKSTLRFFELSIFSLAIAMLIANILYTNSFNVNELLQSTFSVNKGWFKIVLPLPFLAISVLMFKRYIRLFKNLEKVLDQKFKEAEEKFSKQIYHLENLLLTIKQDLYMEIPELHEIKESPKSLHTAIQDRVSGIEYIRKILEDRLDYLNASDLYEPILATAETRFRNWKSLKPHEQRNGNARNQETEEIFNTVFDALIALYK